MKRRKKSQRKAHQQKKLTLKELLEIFRDIENTKDKMLEAGPNLERNIAVQQGIKIMFSPCHEFYNEKKEASTAQITLHKFF